MKATKNNPYYAMRSRVSKAWEAKAQKLLRSAADELWYSGETGTAGKEDPHPVYIAQIKLANKIHKFLLEGNA